MSFPHNLDLLPPDSKLELIIVLAPSSLFLLSNVGKRLSTGNFTYLDSSKSSDSSKSVYFSNVSEHHPPNMPMSGTKRI